MRCGARLHTLVPPITTNIIAGSPPSPPSFVSNLDYNVTDDDIKVRRGAPMLCVCVVVLVVVCVCVFVYVWWWWWRGGCSRGATDRPRWHSSSSGDR